MDLSLRKRLDDQKPPGWHKNQKPQTGTIIEKEKGIQDIRDTPVAIKKELKLLELIFDCDKRLTR